MIKSFAKINIFLKICSQVSIENRIYHTFLSRFMKVYDLYDEIEITHSDKFEINGDFGCSIANNSIYKVHQALLPYLKKEIRDEVNALKICVNKKIPKGGGLGGGSSNAASYLLYINEYFDLKLQNSILQDIGKSAGSDVGFFLSGLDVADISGIGDIINSSNEIPFEVEILDSGVFCDTSLVYRTYSDMFYSGMQEIQWLRNEDVFNGDAYFANDLLNPLLILEPDLVKHVNDGYFLSGSGGCFWKKK